MEIIRPPDELRPATTQKLSPEESSTDFVLQYIYETDTFIKCADWSYGGPGQSVPAHIRESIAEYIVHGCPLGGFLKAFFSNDLFAAIQTADEINIKAFENIHVFICSQIPVMCYGSPEKYRLWIEKDGLIGQREAFTGMRNLMGDFLLKS